MNLQKIGCHLCNPVFNALILDNVDMPLLIAAPSCGILGTSMPPEFDVRHERWRFPVGANPIRRNYSSWKQSEQAWRQRNG